MSLTSVDWPLLQIGRRSLGSAFWISIPLVTHENIKTADDCLMVYVRVSQILGALIRRKNQESNLYLSGAINGGIRCFVSRYRGAGLLVKVSSFAFWTIQSKSSFAEYRCAVFVIRISPIRLEQAGFLNVFNQMLSLQPSFT